MPLLQAMSERANARFTRAAVQQLHSGLVSGDSLAAVVQSLEIATNDAELAYLMAWPSTLREVMRTVLVSAVSESQPLTVSWAPGYDYRINLWEAADTDVSPGGLTMLLQSRYPGHAPIPGM